MDKLVVNTRLSVEEFKKAMMEVYYRTFAGKLIPTIGIIAWLTVPFLWPHESASIDQLPITPIFIGVFLIFFFPIQLKAIAGRVYNDTPRHRENITYIVEEGQLFIKGESFSSQFPLSKLMKIMETKHWCVLYETSRIFYFIPRTAISDEDIRRIKEMKVSTNTRN